MSLKMRLGILPNHPSWPLILKYITIENKPSEVRIGKPPSRLERLNFIPNKKIPIADQMALLAIEMPCVATHKNGVARKIHPVKRREGWGNMWLHFTCDQAVNPSCSRSKACRKEVDAVIAAIRMDRNIAA